jgi:hypothetical protein
MEETGLPAIVSISLIMHHTLYTKCIKWVHNAKSTSNPIYMSSPKLPSGFQQNLKFMGHILQAMKFEFSWQWLWLGCDIMLYGIIVIIIWNWCNRPEVTPVIVDSVPFHPRRRGFLLGSICRKFECHTIFVGFFLPG